MERRSDMAFGYVMSNPVCEARVKPRRVRISSGFHAEPNYPRSTAVFGIPKCTLVPEPAQTPSGPGYQGSGVKMEMPGSAGKSAALKVRSRVTPLAFMVAIR